MFEHIRLSFKTLLTHKLRSFLTILGIIFGVAAVISMMSIGEGARKKVLQQIQLMGIRNIFVMDEKRKRKQLIKKKLVLSKGLNEEDVKSIKRLVPGIENISVVKNADAFTESMGEHETIRIAGVSQQYFKLMDLKLRAGRLMQRLDYLYDERICIIGHEIKRKFFRLVNPVNHKIQLNKIPYTVIGVLSKKFTSTESLSGSKTVDNFDNSIFVPYTSLIIKNNIKKDQNTIDKIIISIKDEKQIVKTAELISKIITHKHYYIDDYQIVIPKQLLKQKQETQRVFNIVMVSIASIALLVGGIGIMNIMLASVMERTREIGLRRALGATMLNIRNQFLLEAVILTVFGGIIGIMLGYLLTLSISLFAEWQTSISLISIFLSFGISTIVGIIFGYYPAVQASRLNPIEALRHE